MFKCKCANCGWTTKRAAKNITRKCLKCGGPVYVHEEDREALGLYVVLFMIGAAILGLIFYAANGHLGPVIASARRTRS